MPGMRSVPIVAFSLLGAQSLAAAECSIEKAIYREPEMRAELRFAPADGENSPLSHRFSLVLGGKRLDGHVMYDPEIERPVAMILNNCPEGDVTGADIAACTVWRGIIYAGDQRNGHIGLLPSEGEVAAPAIVLPGFGPAWMASSAGKSDDAMPWDVFSLEGCDQ